MLKQDELQSRFDDITVDEVGTWSQVCNKHIVLLNLSEEQLDRSASDSLICGVDGCDYPSSAYIDFKGEE